MLLLSLEKCPFNLDWLPPGSYLVGGAVRDALLNIQRDYLDLDFIIPTDAIALAQKIARHYRAGFVILDQQRQIARVVFPEGTVDFALQEGDTLESDLARRDFTINAIAYNPHRDILLDTLGGLADLEQKQLKMISVANLKDDPLRLLRAYRQAAQLNFTIETNTRKQITNLAPLLAQVAPERVRSELDYLFANPQGSYWLTQAYLDGILTIWLKNVTMTKLELLKKIEANWLTSTWSSLEWETAIIPLTRLTCLVADNPLDAETELIKLKYSRDVFTGIKSVLTHFADLENNQDNFSLAQQYFFFLGIGKNLPILAAYALTQGINTELITLLLNRYSNPDDLVAHPRNLVTGNDLIKHLQLKPGPQIGELLTAIQLAQIEGKITTAREALEYAKVIEQQK
ncbi:MAG: CCA tRNA nucleotidyltransferase [Gloeocapsa sp. DLM2.Bin57]|nr:MAG: CCA tRNA nucleotidyltransferase [Gloeocapsa sp. DLM2.Bin57]